MPVELSRRDFLRVSVAASASLLAACIARSPSPTPTATHITKPTASAVSSPTTPKPTAASIPKPADRIKNIVIFIQENHTFDNLFAGFPGADGGSAARTCPIALSSDPPHQHRDALTPNGATIAAANCSYTESDVPTYWQIAREFVLCDRYFSEVRGPSHPNYLMLMAAQSPIVNTPFPSDVCPDFCLDLPTIADRLDAAKVSWRDYAGMFTDIKNLVGRQELTEYDDVPFFNDAAAGALPNVAWLNSGFLTDGDAKSGHPPASICGAENYAVCVLNAIMHGPQWNSTAIVLVWDDWGGFTDHVEPPIVESLADGTPFRYGFRVPCLVISPFAKQGYVSHQLHSHVSTLRFIESIFDLEPLTQRDAQASDLLDCFDFSQAPRLPIDLVERACG
jgi:phospholipase C